MAKSRLEADAKKTDRNIAGSFLRHVTELRKRVVTGSIAFLIASIICFTFYKEILEFLYIPLQALNSNADGENLLYVYTLFEGFLTKMKISAISGIILSMPVHLYNIVKFIYPGLEKKEKRVISVSLFVSFILVVASFYYTYYKVIPISIEFLSGKGFIPEQVGMLLNYGKNVFYILQFLFGALLIFQIPVVLELLMMMNIVNRKALFRSSKYIIVLVFIMSAIVTPPDFISQVSFAVPLIILFFLTILIAKIFKFGSDN